MIRNPNLRAVNWYLIVCLVVAAVATAATSFAEPPGIVFPKYYPEAFTGTGHIGRIGDKHIVIDDQQFFLSGSASYHTLTNPSAYLSDFEPGMLVGFITGPNREIISLWYIME